MQVIGALPATEPCAWQPTFVGIYVDRRNMRVYAGPAAGFFRLSIEAEK